jgi:hypothetical protein
MTRFGFLLLMRPRYFVREWPSDGHRGFAASNRGISLVNFKGSYGWNASANHLSLFARKPQIPLAFVPEESNGYDVLKGA